MPWVFIFGAFNGIIIYFIIYLFLYFNLCQRRSSKHDYNPSLTAELSQSCYPAQDAPEEHGGRISTTDEEDGCGHGRFSHRAGHRPHASRDDITG